MRRAFAVSLLSLLALVTACGGGGPRKRVFPPTASVQELALQRDGSWTLKLRLQNFSNVPMLIERIEAELKIKSAVAGTLALTPRVSVPPESVEVIEATLRPRSAAANFVPNAFAHGSSVSYRLSGTIATQEPERRRDEFEFTSQLSPVPGLSHVLR